jgi:hypothetical protein
MFGMSKVVAERSAEAKEAEVESALPLQTLSRSRMLWLMAACCLLLAVCHPVELNNQ